MEIEKYVEDLISRMDPGQERAVLDAWLEFGKGENKKGPFLPPKRRPSESRLPWPAVSLNDTLEDPSLMVYSQLRRLHLTLENGDSNTLCIRPNYGVGTLATMFGAEVFVMPREMETLPNVRAMGADGVKRILEDGGDLLSRGVGPSVLRIAEEFLKFREKYPLFKEFVLIEHPDLQGPMDNAELLWGSDIFYEFYEHPDTVHALLQRITDAMQEVLDQWLMLFPGEYGVATGVLVTPGHIYLRNDSAMNLSPEFFREFIVPYDSQLLKKYGGIVHFCGRGDHYIELLSRQEGLHGIDMSQPELNRMEVILENTIDRGIPLAVRNHPISLEGHRKENIYFV